jgi:hypothetical protein
VSRYKRRVGRASPSSAALDREMTAWGRGGKAYHGRHVASATPPIRTPAFDGQAKAAPYPGPDDEPRRRPKYVHLRASSITGTSHSRSTKAIYNVIPQVLVGGE